MKRSSALILPLLVGCSSPVEVTDADALLLTDRGSYEIEPVRSGFGVSIEYVFSNRTGGTVEVSNCHGSAPPYLQKLVGDTWVYAWAPVVALCQSAPIEIPAGGQHRGTIRVRAYTEQLRGREVFPHDPVEGRYRLRWPSAEWPESSRFTMPDRFRVSNPFLLVEP